MCAKRIREISKEIKEIKLVKLNKERIGLEDELMQEILKFEVDLRVREDKISAEIKSELLQLKT